MSLYSFDSETNRDNWNDVLTRMFEGDVNPDGVAIAQDMVRDIESPAPAEKVNLQELLTEVDSLMSGNHQGDVQAETPVAESGSTLKQSPL